MGKYEADTKLRQLRKNGQVVQPNVEFSPDNNGWPEPLTDPSTPYKIAVNDGKNGEVKDMDGMKTSQDTWSLPEGSPAGGAPEAQGTSGQRASGEKTSQKTWSDPGGGGAKVPEKQWLNDGDQGGRGNMWNKTSQQKRSEHHDVA